MNDHLSSPTIARWIKRVNDLQTDRLLRRSPCSRQGLPSPHVTVRRCELLPRSFHPYPAPFKQMRD